MIKQVLVATALAATTLVVAPPASADTPGCVTRAEFQAAKKGMTKPKVHGIFDTAGERMSIASSGGYSSEIRSYTTCSPYSSVVVAWDKNPGKDWKLSAKSAVWVG